MRRPALITPTPFTSPTSPTRLQPIGIDDLISLNIPPRELLLDPIIPTRGLAMIHAKRGGAKTFLALSIGLAVAFGTNLLRWSVPKPGNVLYIDGEMALSDLKSRVITLKTGMSAEIPNERFRLLASDHTALPNLAHEVGQRAIDPLLRDLDLLILDNLSTLAWTGSDNHGDSWSSMQEWLLRLRRSGVAVLVVHHSNKIGDQRGTSRREDVLDTVLSLKRPVDYSPDEGARFEVHVEKSRAFSGDASKPFEASLASTGDGRGLTWVATDLKPNNLDEAIALFRSGISVREVAARLGMTKSTAGRLRQKAQEDGLLDSDDGEEGSGTVH
jgi:putative DNA primase/helicase